MRQIMKTHINLEYLDLQFLEMTVSVE